MMMLKKQIYPGQLCEFPGCIKAAATILQPAGLPGTHEEQPMIAYCDEHVEETIDRLIPYSQTCPNCGCIFEEE